MEQRQAPAAAPLLGAPNGSLGSETLQKTMSAKTIPVALSQGEWDNVKLALMSRRDEFRTILAAQEKSGSTVGLNSIKNTIEESERLIKKLFSIPEISP